MSRQGQYFRWQIFMCALRPLQAIATIGLNADAKAAEIKEWTLADLWASEPQAPERLAMVSRYVFNATKDIQRYQVPKEFLPDQEKPQQPKLGPANTNRV
jgi:hypothetical protein